VHSADRFLVADQHGVIHFRHRLVRDAAYTALPFSQRRQLHARAAQCLQQDTQTMPNPPLESLSLHLWEAGDFSSAWTVGQQAADRARVRFANVEAVELYERAISAARRAAGKRDPRLTSLFSSLGDVANLAGFYDRADNAYASAARLCASDQRQAAVLALKRARLASRTGRTALALRRITHGLRLSSQDKSAEAERVSADLHVLYAWMRQQQGKPTEARKRIDLVLSTTSDARARADALLLLDWILLAQGNPSLATNADEALRLLEDLGAFEEIAVAQNNLGGYAYYQGKWEQAIDRYSEARIAFDVIGDTLHAAMADLNIAEIRIDQGMWQEAATLLDRISKLWRSMSFDLGMALAQNLSARVSLLRGDYLHAIQEFDRLRAVFASLDRPGKVVEIDAWRAAGMLATGEPQETLDLIDEALKRERSLASSEMTALLHRVRAQAHAALHQPDEAAQAIDQSIKAARKRGSIFEEAKSIEAAAQILDTPRFHSLGVDLEQARRNLNLLGVKRIAAS
jgi:tetratricopeptide (TPR) repeat protein